MFYFLPIAIFLLQTFWQFNIKYPPSLDQLNLGVSNPIELLIIRIVSICLLISSCYIFSLYINNKARIFYWIIISCAAFLYSITLTHPEDCLLIFFVSIAYFLYQKQRNKLIFIFALFTVVAGNLYLSGKNSYIVNLLSLKIPQEEVNLHYLIEDKALNSISIPRFLKRLAYNKYFFALKDLTQESLNFFDIETLFFRNVHPLEPKTFVMFYFPEFLLLVAGSYFLINNKIKINSFSVLICLSFFYFLSKSGSPDRRLALLFFPVSILIAESFYYLSSLNILAKRTILFLLFACVYGWATNYLDVYKRPEYWLENRPLIYQNIFNLLPNNIFLNKNIYISDSLYEFKKYCNFYLNNCPNFKSINNFADQKSGHGDNLFIGFTGNYLGVNFSNKFSSESLNNIKNSGFKIKNNFEVKNNVANGYGQEIIISEN